MTRTAGVAVLLAILALSAGWAGGEQGAGGPAAKQAATPALKEMEGTTCPVSGLPINKTISYEYKGTIYHFCCPICLGQFKEDPEKYIRKMKKD